MPVKTNNSYGKITIANDAIAKVTATVSLECYGIVELVSKGLIDSLACLFFPRKRKTKGVNVKTSGDRIYLDVYVVIKFGVSISAVAESLKTSIKYKIEKFTGMIVDTVNVNIVGVKL